MFLDRKPFIFLWRPVYWLAFEMIIHPALRRLWTYLLNLPLPPAPPNNSMGAHLAEIERIRKTLDRIDSALSESKREWLATERLLLALMQESSAQRAGTPDADSAIDSSNRA